MGGRNEEEEKDNAKAPWTQQKDKGGIPVAMLITEET